MPRSTAEIRLLTAKATSHAVRHRVLGVLTAKLDGRRAEDQRHEQQHKDVVEPGEDSGVDIGERREQRTAARDEPDLVAVPDRPDGVEQHAALAIVLEDSSKGPVPRSKPSRIA